MLEYLAYLDPFSITMDFKLAELFWIQDFEADFLWKVSLKMLNFCQFIYINFSDLFSGYLKKIWAVTWDFQQCGMCDQQSLRSACAYAQSDQSLC